MFPGTAYANVSGGEPLAILSLTHEQLVAFHRRFYHPRNALFYTYGRLPLEPVLKTVDAALCRKLTELADVPWAPVAEPKLTRFAHPRRVTVASPIEPSA